ncbi:nucleotidyl transferase AbiEii/AbiGii toxin family protein [Massilia sp. ZL223]|uniref:nucleotidyl transferase AbiEii/AbiGii toxin family protein n=1 Tax=Massilia sp. ZL223 TaxID=2824904 RepID=UPI001B82539F|nr:nucleotidyl transferase AbiEii/AbiGii toxin family protein [Massilia sp. ZL223]MBQ5964675.1 nucleotidyl transferase AbiEii/AbiGii toxin family protein [Massilia sp. ZL223]
MADFNKLPPEEQGRAFSQAAARKGWAAPSVEKDYWVCITLGHLFAMPELEGHLTFKGGTSLSKAWGLIDRFSEDIDLTIGRELLGFGGKDSPEHAPSSKQMHRRLANLRKDAALFVQGRVLPSLRDRISRDLAQQDWSLELDPDDPDQQTILFNYPSRFEDNATRYLRPRVKIEFGARSDPWPAVQRPIQPIIAELFPKLEIAPVQVQVLAPERTFWEKAMLLHEERFRPADKARRGRMARHYYDLYSLIGHGVARAAAADLTLFEQVAAHRRVFFRQTWVDYATLHPATLDVLPTEEQVDEWRKDYAAMRAEMFSTEPPAFDLILQRVRDFQDAFRLGLSAAGEQAAIGPGG